MDITFITPTPPDISAFGIRSLSAYLKNRGFKVRVIFLPGGIDKLREKKGVRYKYSERAAERIRELTEDSRYVGVSFMSQYLDRAIEATEMAAEGVPVIWGGVHAVLRPEQSLRYADMVCMGEGEFVLERLLEGNDSEAERRNLEGLWSKNNGDIVKNPPARLIKDLNQIPPFDFGLENHYILDHISDSIVPLDRDLMSRIFPLMPYFNDTAIPVYRTMVSRGCPHECTYCASRSLAEKFGVKEFLRWRDTRHVMEELKTVISRFPELKGVHFFDDVFTAMPREKLENFCAHYKKEIGLPFYCQASPKILDRSIMELLLDSGMVFIELGIQTGSPEVRKIYRRHETNQEILNAAALIHEYRKRLIKPHYHVILDNPWETPENTAETIVLLSRLPGRFQLCISSLVLYPGTRLYDRGKREGLIQDEFRDIYRKPFYLPRSNYLNWLVSLTDVRWIPRSFFRSASRPFFLKTLHRSESSILWDIGFKISRASRLLYKGFKSLLSLDFKRIFRYFRRVR